MSVYGFRCNEAKYRISYVIRGANKLIQVPSSSGLRCYMTGVSKNEPSWKQLSSLSYLLTGQACYRTSPEFLLILASPDSSGSAHLWDKHQMLFEIGSSPKQMSLLKFVIKPAPSYSLTAWFICSLYLIN